MIELINNAAKSLDLNVGVKDGAVLTDDLPGFTTKKISVNPEDPYLVGLVRQGVVTVKSPSGELKKVQAAATPAAETKA